MATTARRFHVGSLELVCLTDGHIGLPPESMFPSVPQEDIRANGMTNAEGLVQVGFNSLVVRSSGKLVLIDTGLGDKPSNPFGGAGGELIENFRANGLNPDEIDIVINTHGHPDHVGW
ncbi:MAG TPA: MBL fold metallo-hydrolase, partial [Dehalococcoidia bacterium]|nr:MBL fold metallo-hydrolase [Dehalococcoidia bacterium]